MPQQLLNDEYAPITSTVGFLECDAATAAASFREWQHPIQAERGVSLKQQEIAGDFISRIESLLPLTSVEGRRFLFMPTKRSNWTAYLDNGWRGTDVFSVVSYLCRIVGCRGIRAVCVPNTIRQTSSGERGRYGATILEVYAADTTSCDFLNIQRSISAANDGGRWRFDANGDPMSFERLNQYKAKRVSDRFTPDMLQEYLETLGIDLFSTAFYEVPEPALLITKHGPYATGLKEYSLKDAQKNY